MGNSSERVRPDQVGERGKSRSRAGRSRAGDSRADCASKISPARACIEPLEPRQLLTVVAPVTTIVYTGYREAPDGGTVRSHIIWVDNNTTETGYRVEWSSDGVSNWQNIGADLPANTSTTTRVLVAGEKAYYRVSALENGVTSAPGPVTTASMPSDRTVAVTASAHGGVITLAWPNNNDAVSYTVYRKARTDTTWTLLTLRALPARTNSFLDLVPGGSAYEYCVKRFQHNYFYGADGTANGYIYAGNQLSAVESRGRALLVVDQTLAPALATSLTTFRRDLLADGWAVDQILVPRDNGDAHQAVDVKTSIQQIAAARAGGIQSIILIGHVPVPYSGGTAWDGHPDHGGAWPSDSVYGESIGMAAPNPWTDTKTILNSLYPDNNNLPGDGKFDQDFLPNPVNVAVGRIDFANLASMRFTLSPVPDTDADAEPLLIARYLQKDHLWRTGQISVPQTAIEDDELGGVEAENGWRNFAPLVGANALSSADWQTQLGAASNLWSFGLGPGAVDNAINVVSTLQLHADTSRVNSVFNMLYGSYFGDWNKSSDLMREVIASQGTSLVSMWVGAPNWFVQTMGLGETVGQATVLTQNDSQNGPYTPTSTAMQSTSVSLMGDPTITMSVAKRVTGLSAPATASTTKLTWNAPANAIVDGYYLYRAASSDGPFTKLAYVASPADGSTPTFTDGEAGSHAGFTYMVRAVELQTTPSGSYWNVSAGVTVRARNSDASILADDASKSSDASISPNGGGSGIDNGNDSADDNDDTGDADLLDQLTGNPGNIPGPGH